jgi:hypothetical protein
VTLSLDDAWQWYAAVKKLVWMMDRIAKLYWSEEVEDKTLKETLHKDDRFREIEAGTIQDLASRAHEYLDDLAVLLLFSVFEAHVRDRTLEEMDRELENPPRHLVLKKAVDDARDAVEHGSFGRLTESYKALSPDVRTLVDQVRHYRNWVAHGRRDRPRNDVDPESALERLTRFLALLDADAAASATALLVEPGLGSDEGSQVVPPGNA